MLGDVRDPVGAARRAAERIEEAKQVERQQEQKQLGGLAKELAAAVAPIGPIEAVIAEVPASSPKQILQMAKAIQAERPGAGVVLAGADEGAGKVGIVVLFDSSYAGELVSAADLISEIAPVVGGGGGGSDEMAQAGGKDPGRLEEAMLAARAWLEGR